MATAPTLTPTEVIDRVRAARKAQQQQRSKSSSWHWSGRGCTPAPPTRHPAHWGEADLHDEGLVPLAGPGAPWVAEFAPVDLAAALGITQDAGRQLIADALELGHRLPRLWERVLAGAVPVWRARLIARETTDLSVAGGAVRGPADRRHPAPDRSGPGRPAGPGGPAVLRPRPRPRRRGRSPHQARCLAAPRHRPGHHRHHDDPGHPRRAALRPDPHPHRRRPQGARRHRGPSRSAAPARSGSSPTPSSPWTSSPAARRSTQPSARAGAANLYVHLTPADLAADLDEGTGAASIEKLGAATTRLLTDWLTRFAAAGTKITLRPVLDLNSDQAVDQHDPPEAMRETVVLRDATASSPAAAATPGPATSTTSPNTSPWKTADHRAKPVPAISHRCAEPITASRPTPPGTTNASTTAAMRGPRPPGTSTTSCRPRGCPDGPERLLATLRGRALAVVLAPCEISWWSGSTST